MAFQVRCLIGFIVGEIQWIDFMPSICSHKLKNKALIHLF